MRVMMSSWAGGGHFAPLVPLGWALRAAGHEVLVACHPAQADAVVRAGLPALPLGPDVDMFALLRAKRAGRAWRPRRGGEPDAANGCTAGPAGGLRGYPGMLETAEAVADVLADELVAFCRAWPVDLVVYEPAAVVGPLVGRVLGVPAVRQLWTVDFTAPVNGFPAYATGALAERFGIEAFGTSGDLTLDPCPARLQVRDDLPRQPIRYIPYNGPAVLPGWLRDPPAGRRVGVTWGTSLTGLHRDLRHVPDVVRALGALDAEIVVAVPDADRELFSQLPPTVTAVGPVPLHLLLPSCDLVVHQGGGGTLMTALACGVPQVIVPSITDQAFNARHVAGTGAGLVVDGGDRAPAAAVLRCAQQVLGAPGYLAAARRLQSEHLSRPSPAEVVPVLERLALECAVTH
jgi:UDP:flavonoid glycosyltransferase YjiC (YdhE family)